MTRFMPESILDLWFPDTGHWLSGDDHSAFWATRMRGGMDQIICDRFADITIAAACGELDHWADTPRGRLALLIALDQFPRSLWRDTPAAFGQDIKATRLALDGIDNGHYAALPYTWERQFYIIAMTHCEGPDHLARMDQCVDLTEQLIDIALPVQQEFAHLPVEQVKRVRDIIARFGRHPHRNTIYGRVSSPAEQDYIDAGIFPHKRDIRKAMR